LTSKTKLSAAFLIAANAIPLLGVVFLGWPLARLLAIYWAETAVIGVFNIFKMLLVSPVGGLFLGAFFAFHFGMFMFGHSVFLAGFFLDGFGEFGEGPAQLLGLLGWELLALVVSHGVSFFVHWIVGDERRGRTLHKQMMEPYGRIIVMHVSIIFGGFAVMALGTPAAVLVLFIALKTAVDLRAHLKEHRGGNAAGPP